MEHLRRGRKGRARAARTFRRVDKPAALRHQGAMDPVRPPLALPEGDLIVFDAACLFCSGFARFMHRWDRAGRFRFVTAQSATGRALYRAHGLDPDRMETNIVITGGQAHIKMPAFAAAMRALGAPWSVLAVFGGVPDPVGVALKGPGPVLALQVCMSATGTATGAAGVVGAAAVATGGGGEELQDERAAGRPHGREDNAAAIRLCEQFATS